MYIKIHRSHSSPLLSRSFDPNACIKPINLNDSAFFENDNNVSNIKNQKSINNYNKTVTHSQKLKEHDYIDLMINPLTKSNLDYHKTTFPPSQENKTSYVESFIKQQKTIFENEIESERKIKEEIQSMVSLDISVNSQQKHGQEEEQVWLNSSSNSSTNDSKLSKDNHIPLKQDNKLYKNNDTTGSYNNLTNINIPLKEEEEKSENTLLTNKVKNISVIKNKCLQTLSRWIKPKHHHNNNNNNNIYKKEELVVVDNSRLILKDSNNINSSNIKIIISPAEPSSTSPTIIIDDYPATTQNMHLPKINEIKRRASWSINTSHEENKSKKGWKGSKSPILLSPPLPNHIRFQFKKGNNSRMTHDSSQNDSNSNFSLPRIDLPRIDLTSASSQSSSSSTQINKKSSFPLSPFSTTTSTTSSKQNDDKNKKPSGMSFLQRTLSNAKRINLKSSSKYKKNTKMTTNNNNNHDHELDVKNNNPRIMDDDHNHGLNTKNDNQNNINDDHELIANNNNNIDGDDHHHDKDKDDDDDDDDDEMNIGLYTAKNKSTHFEEIYSPKLKSFNEEEIASSVMKNSGLDYFQFPKMDPIQVKI